GLRTDEDLRDLAEVLHVVAALALALVPELHQELPVARELHDVGIALGVAADPDVALVVGGDAVVRGGPFVARPGAAPVPDQVPGRVDLPDGRRAEAAAIS